MPLKLDWKPSKERKKVKINVEGKPADVSTKDTPSTNSIKTSHQGLVTSSVVQIIRLQEESESEREKVKIKI